MPMLPDVPTLAESGHRASMRTLVGDRRPGRHAGGCRPALNAEINKLLTSPELGKFLTNEGAEPEAMAPQEFGDMIHWEVERWTRVAHEANISID